MKSNKNAIDKLNGVLLNNKQVSVGPFIHKQEERESAVDKAEFNNIYMKNLSESVTDEDLKKICGEYGSIISSVVIRDGARVKMCWICQL
ncbi:hypothetical protein SLEP1_g8222 [Rubroshorea leprosula]|uniref:RRM domain-containing protein n=1 Tax=Rubroshorea leprosula TaxID=152421 RepID=A0AAV5IBX7_9ROSI|nr:hypothetical protein SLEP1_g8222 [Rubroshorea leprosula]